MPASRALIALLCASALSLGLGACGSGDPVERVPGAPSGPNAPTAEVDPSLPATSVTEAPPVASAPEATTPATTTTSPSAPATGGAPAPGGGAGTGGVQAQDSGAGAFVIAADGTLGPSGVQAPAAVPVTLTIRNDDDEAHEVTVLLEDRPVRRLAPGATATVELDALAPGSYTMLLDGGGSAAVLQVGANAGP